MGDWESVKAENLVRHRKSGIYYLRAKVSRKIIRKSLHTQTLKIAKLKRDDLLLQMRASEGSLQGGGAVTLQDSLAQVRAWYAAQPTYQKKPRSLKYRDEIIKVLVKTLPQHDLPKWTTSDMVKWWGSAGIVRYSATRRNNMLGTLRKMIELSIDQGTRMSDPTSGLKRIEVIVEEVTIPSKEEFHLIVNDILTKGKSHSVLASRFVEFMAYSGCRPGETIEVKWEDIQDNHLKVTGGEGGTKNHRTRRVPINASLAGLLDRMIYDGAYGKIFPMTPPKDAIKNSCKRLGLPHFTPKTFRHVFGTTCLECGVPIATVADWMGHKDKGVTLANTYAHIRDEHGITQAAKVVF